MLSRTATTVPAKTKDHHLDSDWTLALFSWAPLLIDMFLQSAFVAATARGTESIFRNLRWQTNDFSEI
jgi:hypothetical protein